MVLFCGIRDLGFTICNMGSFSQMTFLDFQQKFCAARDEIAKRVVDKYQFPFDKHYDDCVSYVKEGFDECFKFLMQSSEWAEVRDALTRSNEWIKERHEMPNYSEMILNNEKALATIRAMEGKTDES